MATQQSPEASEIRRRGRQRLIGAVAIVLLLVVFVPMVLDPEPRPASSDPVMTIPPKDNAPALPAPPPAPASGAVMPKPQEVVAKAVATPPVPGAPVADPAAAPKPAEPPKPEAAKVTVETKEDVPANPKAAPRLEGFAVQVGAFRDEAKLRQAREKLQAAGVVHYTERLDTRSGPLTRLRAGPFATRAEAETALAILRRGALDGKVVPLS